MNKNIAVISKKICKKILLISLVVMTLARLSIIASATSTEFFGKIEGGSFTYLNSKTYCSLSTGNSRINWFGSSVGDINVWFRINDNKTGDEVGSAYLKGRQSILIDSATVKGRYYNLYGSRQYFFDGPVSISGKWEP